MSYKANPTPGSFSHRSMDCPEHGDNVVHARAIGSLGPFSCVACLLLAAQKQLALVSPFAAWESE